MTVYVSTTDPRNHRAFLVMYKWQLSKDQKHVLRRIMQRRMHFIKELLMLDIG
jgi:hypothetical protein